MGILLVEVQVLSAATITGFTRMSYRNGASVPFFRVSTKTQDPTARVLRPLSWPHTMWWIGVTSVTSSCEVAWYTAETYDCVAR